MTRGTSPDIELVIPDVNLESCVSLYVTIKQDYTEVTKTLDDIEITDGKLYVSLSQEDTLRFKPPTAQIQVRGILDTGKAFATSINTIPVDDILKNGVIT